MSAFTPEARQEDFNLSTATLDVAEPQPMKRRAKDTFLRMSQGWSLVTGTAIVGIAAITASTGDPYFVDAVAPLAGTGGAVAVTASLFG